MLIKRIKFSDISSLSSSAVSIGKIKFYDGNGVRINFGKIISNSSDIKFETEIAYLDSTSRHNGTIYEALNGGIFNIVNKENDARVNFQIVFKHPVTISKFEMDTAARWSIDSNMKVDFYNTDDELVKSYIINPSDFEYSTKGSLRLTQIPTSELVNEQRYLILSEKKPDGTVKNYTIEKKEVNAIPLIFTQDFDDEISKVNAYMEEGKKTPIEHVFKNNPPDDYYLSYVSIDKSNIQYAHPSVKIEFKKPKLINAIEIQSKWKRNVHITFEGYDEINKEWNILSDYKSILLNGFTKIRMEFDNSKFYFQYKITFVNLNNEPVNINDIKLIEYQSFLKEISVSSSEDYKKYGIKSDEYISTNKVLKKVLQKNKNILGIGHVFAKSFDNKNKEIKSITM